MSAITLRTTRASYNTIPVVITAINSGVEIEVDDASFLRENYSLFESSNPTANFIVSVVGNVVTLDDTLSGYIVTDTIVFSKESVKAAPLYNEEIDSNLFNLNLQKIDRDGSVPFLGDIWFTAIEPTIHLATDAMLTLGDASSVIRVPGYVLGDIIGDIYAADGVTKILETGGVYGAGASLVADVIGDLVGNVTGDLVGNVTGNVSGNAGTATALATARNFSISGMGSASAVSFDGSAPVNLNLSITSIAGLTADSATVLAASRTIALAGDIAATGVAFNGSANISLTTAIGTGKVTPTHIAASGTFEFPALKVSASGLTVTGLKSTVVSVAIPAALASMATALVTITLTGATFSTFVVAQPTAALTDTVAISAYVSAADTLTIAITNAGVGATTGQTLNFNILVIN
jgi:hypothetical protein